MADEGAKVRVVRCPKCDKLLPELANFTVYRCGGCNATLQARRRSTASDVSLEKSDAEIARYFEDTDIFPENKVIMVSDASSEINPKAGSIEFRGEDRKLCLKRSPISDSSSDARTENEDGLKNPQVSKLGESPTATGTKGRDRKHQCHSENLPDVPNANLDELVQEKVEEVQETKIQLEGTNENPKFPHKKYWRSGDRDRTSAFRRSNPYPDEGPSNYCQNPAKRQNLDCPSSDGHLDQDRAELLRKLDELRDQLRRSCEVQEKPKDRPSASRTFSCNPHARNGRNNWFPEGSSSLNRTTSRHSPFMSGHSLDIPNLYPTVHTQNGIPGYREVYGPHSLGRAPLHPASQYPRPMSNCLYGQFDPDPLVSYHHDGFYHQPACSCLHCYNSHWPSLYNNQRVPYPGSNHGFYQVDGPPVLGQQNYSQRDPNGPLTSNDPRSRRRPLFMKKAGRTCQPIAGAAPFVSCYNCCELLQLPEDIVHVGKNRHKLRCGSCSHLIAFDYDGRRLVPSPAQTTNVTSENNIDPNKGTNGHMDRRPTNSYSGSLDSIDYEVHSADEKLVLPSYPVSNNEMLEKEYGFHMSDSEKMQGISSSPSTSDDADSPDSMVCQRDVPNSSELPLETEGISRVPSLPLREHFGYPMSNQVVDGPGNGSRSRRSDQEKILTMNGNFKQNSVKDVSVVSEMDLSADEYLDTGFSQDSWEGDKDEDQYRAKNSKGGESFIAGLIKKSFPRFNQSAENGRCKVYINGHPICDRLVKKAEKLAGPIHPGNYWYDYRAGFWGAIGHACLGIIPPFIEEFNYPMPKNCAGGNTGVFINGRELHHKDLNLLVGRGLPATEGQSYIVEISGKVWDEATGEELDGLGKLAPTIERVKHGFGMRVPRVAM